MLVLLSDETPRGIGLTNRTARARAMGRQKPARGSRLLKAHIFLAFLTTLLAAPASAQTGTDPSVFATIQPCAAYTRFLEGEPAGDTAQCHPLTQALLGASDKGLMQFLRTYSNALPQNAVIRLLVQAEGEMVLGNAARSYMALDFADRALFSALEQSGDLDRARFYASVISNLKADALRGLCADQGESCPDLRGFIPPQDALAGFPAEFADTWPGTLLLCLLRGDNYQVPIREVVQSMRFATCIQDDGKG